MTSLTSQIGSVRRETYSLYEATARLSALVRQVREGSRVVLTMHSRPEAEPALIDTVSSIDPDRPRPRIPPLPGRRGNES